MKRIVTFTGMYFFLLILSQGCETEHYIITDINFKSVVRADSSSLNYEESDNFTNSIAFGISYVQEYVTFNGVDFSTKAYATSRPRKLDNPLIVESFALSFDQPFQYNGVLIPANQNLFEIPEIFAQITIIDAEYYKFRKIIAFSQQFTDNSQFNTSTYNVTFSCETSDERNFEKSVNVFFNIQ